MAPIGTRYTTPIGIGADPSGFAGTQPSELSFTTYPVASTVSVSGPTGANAVRMGPPPTAPCSGQYPVTFEQTVSAAATPSAPVIGTRAMESSISTLTNVGWSMYTVPMLTVCPAETLTKV